MSKNKRVVQKELTFKTALAVSMTEMCDVTAINSLPRPTEPLSRQGSCIYSLKTEKEAGK